MALQHQKIYRTFESYPFDTDRVFVAGLSNILKNMSVGEEDEDEKLLKAKHFYFCR
jgi:hypothetical protein